MQDQLSGTFMTIILSFFLNPSPCSLFTRPTLQVYSSNCSPVLPLQVLIRTKYQKNKDQIRTVVIKNKDLFLFSRHLPITIILKANFKDTIEVKWANPEVMVISLQQGNMHAFPLTEKQLNYICLSLFNFFKIRTKIQNKNHFFHVCPCKDFSLK